MTSVLRSRWLYVVLGLVVGLLYFRFFTSQHWIAAYPSEPAISKSEKAVIPQMELEPAQLMRAGRQHPGALGVLIGASAIALLLGASGLLLTLRAWSSGGITRLLRYPSRVPYAWPITDVGRVIALLAFVALMLPFARVGLVSLGWMAPGDDRAWGLAATVVLEAVLLLVVWAFASAKSMRWPRMFGLTAARMVIGLGRGLRGYVIAFPWVVGLLWAVALLAQRLGIEPSVEAIHELLFVETRGPVVIVTLALACVIGPIAEELFFRGLVFSSLRRRVSRPAAMLISGALFSALHTNLIGFLPILALGWVLADLYERTGSLAAPIAVHIVHNTLLISLAMAVRVLGG